MSPEWEMKQELKNPSYTTCWYDLWRINCR
ncbi:DUF4113 domain-containing protein [Pseudomonas sp. gcc21]